MGPGSQNIFLDTTLRDLYSIDENTEPDIVLITAIPTAKVQMTPWIPLSTKLLYQAPLAETEGSDLLARLNLQVGAQLLAFIAGKMSLIMFDLDEGDSMRASLRTYRSDSFQTFNKLAPFQQPEISFVTKPEDILLHPGAKIMVFNPMDCLLHLPLTVDAEVHYGLLSKRDLSFSGLPTPESQVIETKLNLSQIQDKSLLNNEVARMMRPITEREPPFVIKMPQSLSGHGTFLVRTEADQQKAVGIFAPEIRKLLKQINETNMHMQPGCIVLQEMMPGVSHSLSLFVTRSGKGIMTSCCRQTFEPSGQWDGAFISYKQQDHFQRQYASLIEQLTSFVRSKEYYGPVGVDVMTDQDGKHVIIDMNIRVCGSHPLGLLKNHFSQRNLHEAALLYPLFLSCTRDKFEEIFNKEFTDGSLIINGWCHDLNGETSIASATLAAEDSDALSLFIERLNIHKKTQH